MSILPSASGGEQRPTTATDERCLKNLPGQHLWKLPTFPGYPKFCAYCGKRSEGGAA